MLHKNLANSSNGLGPTLVECPGASLDVQLAPALNRKTAQQRPWFDLEFIRIASRRCSAFFAEAAILVLVFGNLDHYFLKGRMELRWIAGVFLASLSLLAASVFTEARAQRWIDAHP